MLLDIRTKSVVHILKQKYLYRPVDEVLYVCKDYLIYEEPMYNGKSCHSEASYYCSET